MLLTIIRHDFKVLRYQGKMLVMNGILVFALCFVVYAITHFSTSGVLLFGRDNLQMVFIVLLGASSCVEFLGRLLLCDIDDGTRDAVFYFGIKPLEYAGAKAVVPFCISIIDVVLFGIVMAFFSPSFVILPQGTGGLIGAYVLDILFCISVINIISVFFRPDTKNRPNFLIYIVAIHIPIIAFCNPLNNLPLFCIVLTIFILVMFVIYARIISKKYQSNIGYIDND